MKFSFTSSLLLLVLATPSVVAKKGKKTKYTKNKNNVVPVIGGSVNLNCNPMQEVSKKYSTGCKDGDCASTNWEDGCEACMCSNNGNASWCDGTKSTYYDNYFEAHGENPFGDSNQSNRKCNTKFSLAGGSCNWNWECDRGLECNDDDVCAPLNGYCDPMGTGCHDKDCASDMWKDGCLACMCYNWGNASWCDGTKSGYYDNYFEEHGENPFGDSNRSNRKCNTIFSQQDVSCQSHWECDSGLACCAQLIPFGNEKKCRNTCGFQE